VGPQEGWHPILVCQEYKVGHWVMLAQYGEPYAMIHIVRRGGEVGYRVDSWAQKPADAETIGYFTNLRAAARAGHQHFLASHTKLRPGHSITGQRMSAEN